MARENWILFQKVKSHCFRWCSKRIWPLKIAKSEYNKWHRRDSIFNHSNGFCGVSLSMKFVLSVAYQSTTRQYHSSSFFSIDIAGFPMPHGRGVDTGGHTVNRVTYKSPVLTDLKEKRVNSHSSSLGSQDARKSTTTQQREGLTSLPSSKSQSRI